MLCKNIDEHRVFLPLLAATAFAFAVAPARATVTISSAATSNITCSSGVCTPTAKGAVLNVDDLETMLASGNVDVTTTGPGVQARNIAVSAALSWSSGSTLALDARDSITMNNAVSVTGQGGLSLTTAGRRHGTLSFGKKGSVSFQNLSSALSINGTAFTLVNSISAMANAIASNPGGAYALANNYDASGDGTYAASPIPTELTGAVQGLGNTISNVSIVSKRGGYVVAFFQDVEASGSVQNLRLSKLSCRNGYRDGGMGGLVGENKGYLFGDETSGSVRAHAAAGGLVLDNSSTGTIASSSSSARVTADAYDEGGQAGGLVNTNEGTISASYATGDVNGTILAGGLASANYGTIDQSFATGNITGTGAGLVGTQQYSGAISNSYATGAFTGASSVAAGFLGTAADGTATVSTSYSTGAVPTGNGGFLCALGQVTFSNNYWDTTTSGTTYGLCNDENLSGITGLTTQQLQAGLPTGFDPSIWAEKSTVNDGFPYLINNPPPK